MLDLPETVKGRVCSKHFEQSDFTVKGDGHVWLKPGACPLQVDESPEEIVFHMNEVEINEDVSMYDVSLQFFKVTNTFCMKCYMCFVVC